MTSVTPQPHSGRGQHNAQVRRLDQSEHKSDTVAWIVVTVILLGVVTTALGIMAVQWAVIWPGVAVIALGLLLAVVLPKAGVSAPISFTAERPLDTSGPRATTNGRTQPPIDTQPGAEEPDLSPYHTVAEAPASELPQEPDTDRAKPQHVNLAPGERIRRVGGQDVIETPDEGPAVQP
ncbi:MAG: hypothetical protein ACJ786_23885 [Catenulispora sp.]